MSTLRNFNYVLGCKKAMAELGADQFVQFVQNDDIAEAIDAPMLPETKEDTAANWGGKSSLEGGDAGTRNEQLGLPRFSGA